jgi:hypothetical protein
MRRRNHYRPMATPFCSRATLSVAPIPETLPDAHHAAVQPHRGLLQFKLRHYQRLTGEDPRGIASNSASRPLQTVGRATPSVAYYNLLVVGLRAASVATGIDALGAQVFHRPL